MTSGLTRRDALALGTAGLTGVAGCLGSVAAPRNCRGETAASSPAGAQADLEPVAVRGAVYIPSRVFNLYQMWRFYDPAVVERDLGYASRVNLNAVRTWLSFEAWESDPDAFGDALEHFLAAAADRDISVLLGLFDAVGAEPTPDRLVNTNPRTATGIRSPSAAILDDRARWAEVQRFVDWFMDGYRDDDRLLAIEVMNEPGWQPARKALARELFASLVVRRGRIPLTVGSTSIANNTDYARWGSDIFQFHHNFPKDPSVYRRVLQQVAVLVDAIEEPVWLTEWQRTRYSGEFTSNPGPAAKTPNYASLAPFIHEAGIGNFFWSLMVKPAWVQPQRRNGVLNGLFHEDGSVWSLEDARAIKGMSGDPSFEGVERREWPAWAENPNEQPTSEAPD